jgi:hypothetical protein
MICCLRDSRHHLSATTLTWPKDEVVTDTVVTAANSAPKAALFVLAGPAALVEFSRTAITVIADGLAVQTASQPAAGMLSVRPMSALVRITDSSQTSCHVLKMPTAAIR